MGIDMVKGPRLPKRPRSHVVGDRAVNVFRYCCRPEWTLNDFKTDYGADILVTIEESESVKEDFFVQLKGSDSPEYIDNQSKVSISLEVTTINWLLTKPVPSMLLNGGRC